MIFDLTFHEIEKMGMATDPAFLDLGLVTFNSTSTTR